MNTKSIRSRALILVTVALVGLVLLNIISIRVFGRIDLTSNNMFTLSDASRALVGALDDKIAVTAYFTEDLPSPYNNYRRAVLDQLNEYRAYSNGNLVYNFVDPAGTEGEQEAQQQGIAPVQVQVVNEDKFEAKRAYMGLVMFYEDRKEVIPVVQNLGSLEYDISAAIKRITTKEKKKVGFLTGHGEPALEQMQGVQHALAGQYELIPVDLTGGRPVPRDMAALVVMAPKNKIPETHQYEVDQYLMRGGKVAFLLNKVDGTLQERFGRELDLGMDDLLLSYGIRINTDLVRDARCASISIIQQSFGFNLQSQVPFPLLPLVNNFGPENMIVKDLQGMVLFFVSSVDTVAVSQKGLHAELLISSSERSGRMEKVFMINPLAEYAPAEFSEPHIPLAWSLTGSFSSAYADREVPVDSTLTGLVPVGEKLASGIETRMIVVGDGDFPLDAYLGNNDNVTFFANMIDYLVDDAGLITIRTKDVTMPQLDQISDGGKSIVKFGTLIAPPLAVLLFGLFRWRSRRARRNALEQSH